MQKLGNKIAAFNRMSTGKVCGGIFASVFLFCCLAAIFVQFVLIRHIYPELDLLRDPGKGIIAGIDTESFHFEALVTYETVQKEGFGAWKMTPNASGIVGMLSLLYIIFGPHFYVTIPFNGVVFGMAAVFLFLIVKLFFGFRNLTATLTLLPFVLSPSAALWYTQLHKDTVATFAVLGYLFFFGSLFKHRSLRTGWPYLVGACASLFPLWWIRQYMLPVFCIMNLLFIAGLLLLGLVKKSVKTQAPMLLFAAIIIAFCWLFPSTSESLRPATYHGAPPDTTRHKEVLPVYVNGPPPEDCNLIGCAISYVRGFDLNLFAYVHIIRKRFTESSKGTTEVDVDIVPETPLEQFLFLPKAIYNAFLAPFPSQLLASGSDDTRSSLKKLLLGEMLWSYLMLPGVFLILFRRPKSSQEFYALFYCMFFLTLYGLLFTNGGTLNRMRFAVHSVIFSYGMAILVKQIFERKSFKRLSPERT